MMRHPTFWVRSDQNMLKEKEKEIKKIWEKIENDQELDILLILHQLSKLIGKKEINA